MHIFEFHFCHRIVYVVTVILMPNMSISRKKQVVVVDVVVVVVVVVIVIVVVVVIVMGTAHVPFPFFFKLFKMLIQ